MMVGKHLLAYLLLCLLFVSGMGRALAGDLAAIPPFTGPIVDQAGLLQAEQVAQLDRRLRQFSQAHGSQIAVLIVQTTHPETIEAYSTRVFDAWKIGRKQVDDGILILVAARAHKMRIETGYGLEGAIPDAIAKRIIRETMVPKFREGDASSGLLAGIEQIEKLIEGEHLPPPQTTTQVGKSEQGGQGSDGPFSEMLVIGIIAASILGGVLCMIFGRFLGSLATGGLVGTIAWFMSGSLLVMLAAAIIVFLFVLMTGGGGGSFLGGGGFGGGGGDSWSGGGGSSGGGGASGEW